MNGVGNNLFGAAYTLLAATVRFLWRQSAHLVRVVSFGRSVDEPLISSADLSGSIGLQSMAQGMMGDYLYNLMTEKSGKVMMLITLNRNTRMHIVAIGGKSGMNRVIRRALSRKWLEPVSLEGSFPDNFQMYCTKGKQMETRQVFGPETMAAFEDFCKSYNFELFDDSVFISVAKGASYAGDGTTMVTDITNFLEHNRRVLDRI